MLKLTTVATLAALATTTIQLLYGLLTGGFSAGTQLEQVQTELKLIRKDIQSQFALTEAQNRIYEFRLEQLEQSKTKTTKEGN